MWPVFVNSQYADFATGSEFSLGAMADSLYEYLPKQYMLLGGLVPQYLHMYESFMNAAKKTLFFRPMNPDNKDILISGGGRASGNEITRDSSGESHVYKLTNRNPEYLFSEPRECILYHSRPL